MTACLHSRASAASTPATPLPACIPASRKRRHERRAVAAGGAPHRRLPAAAPPPLRGAAAPPRPRRCLSHSLSRREPGGGGRVRQRQVHARPLRSEEHTSELQSLMRISYAVFCLKKKYKNEKLLQSN